MGPVMVGPSSSHTAGAVRMGYVGRKLLGFQPARANIALHGSFAATGAGHGTDKAIVAGLLAMKPDDPGIPRSLQLAREARMDVRIQTVDLRDAHPNSVQMELVGRGDGRLSIQACSTGGGRILVNRLDGVDVSFTGDYHTLIVQNMDNKGNLADVTTALSLARVNVANMSLNRSSKGGSVMMIIETDDPVPAYMVELIEKQPGILQVIHYRKES